MVHLPLGINVATARESLMSHFTASRLGRGIFREVGCSFVTVLELGRLAPAGASETSGLLAGGVVLGADFTLPGAFLVPMPDFVPVVLLTLVAATLVLTVLLLARTTLAGLEPAGVTLMV